jgi:hypothetical protein
MNYPAWQGTEQSSRRPATPESILEGVDIIFVEGYSFHPLTAF